MNQLSQGGVSRRQRGAWRVWAGIGFVALVPMLAGARAAAGPGGAGEPWPHEESALGSDRAVVWGRLSNGLRYVLLPNPEPPGRITLRLYVQAGSLNERDDEQGIAHFLEHMAFNGTRHFPAGKLVETLQRLGMAFGPDVNAHTSFDETVYKLDLSTRNDELVEDGLRLFRDYADGMLLESAEIDRERGVVLNEMRLRDGVDYRTGKAWMTFVFPDALVSRRWPIGIDEVVRSAPARRFSGFYRAWYRPEQLVLVAVGALEPPAFARRIERHFGSARPGAEPAPAPALGRAAAIGGRTRVHVETEAPAAEVELSVARPHRDGPDSVDRRIERLEVDLAHDMLSRRLEILSKKEGAPFYRPQVGFHTLFRFADVAGVSLSCKPERWEETLRMAESELRRALVHGFDAGELREACARRLNTLERAAERAPTRKSPALADSIIAHLGDRRVFQHPVQRLEMERPLLDGTTPARCRDALRRVWGEDPPGVFLSGNLKIERGEAAVADALARSRARPVDPPEARSEQKFAYTEFGPPGVVVDRVAHDDLGIVQVRFANGVRLNVKRTEFEAGNVAVQARIGAGLLELPADRVGLNLLAGSAFVRGGLKQHSADDLERIFAGKNVGATFSVEDDSIVFSGQTSPGDLADELCYLAAHLVAPGYRPEALRQAREEFAEQYRTLNTTLEGVMANELPRFLASGDWRFGWPPEPLLMGRTLDELRAWLEEPLERGYLEISLVGDLEIERAIALVGRTLGALPARASAKPALAERRVVAFPKGAKEKVLTYRSEIAKGAVALCWPGPDIWDIRRVRRLNVLMSILDDRLRVKVREEMGEAYSVGAVAIPSDTYRGYGVILAQAFADPSRIQQVARVMADIAATLHRGGVTGDELDRALRPTLEMIDKQRRTNRYWIGQVLASSQEYPQRLDWARTMVADHRAIRREEIDALARQYLAPERAVRILCRAEQPRPAGRAVPVQQDAPVTTP